MHSSAHPRKHPGTVRGNQCTVIESGFSSHGMFIIAIIVVIIIIIINNQHSNRGSKARALVPPYACWRPSSPGRPGIACEWRTGSTNGTGCTCFPPAREPNSIRQSAWQQMVVGCQENHLIVPSQFIIIFFCSCCCFIEVIFAISSPLILADAVS